ncbi:hypothetical protein HPB52_025296 [Rhipicephalus sanguineus]|uniref:Tick transposon n=1 Tax=Rhipicephalus sanguineus TaxID=34632 RepID=A0A9D4TEB4_RHISA|nr:hypothetical protein HPB52_025296 [Rhipicephalus sanguineus]
MAPRSTLDERRAITVMGRTMSQKAISAATGRPLPTVNRVLRAFYEEGRLADAVRRRPERAPTDEEDRLIVAASVENPFLYRPGNSGYFWDWTFPRKPYGGGCIQQR